MKLGLHQYVDACSEIVDRAGKELTIENGLKRIEDTWAFLNLSFAPYQVELIQPLPSFHLMPVETTPLNACCDQLLLQVARAAMGAESWHAAESLDAYRIQK